MDTAPAVLADLFQAEDRPDTRVILPTSRREVGVRTLLQRELPWAGEEPASFRKVPNKPRLSFDGQVVYPEFILLRLLERAGWSGCWVNNWLGRLWRDIDVEVTLPPRQAELFRQIEVCAGGRGGAWDVFAWHGDKVFFIESKQRTNDRLQSTQLAWLECGLEREVPLSSFLIVEWTRKPAAQDPTRSRAWP